jgi:hypothetical protein
VHDAHKVDADDRRHRLVVEREEVARLGDAGDVEACAQHTEALRRAHDRLDLGGVAHVARDERRLALGLARDQLVHGLAALPGGRLEVAHHHRGRALAGAALGDCAADAAGATEHDGDLAGHQPAAHVRRTSSTSIPRYVRYSLITRPAPARLS